VTRNVASFVLFAAMLSGQSAAPVKPGKVEGVVINSVTNDPVKKAAVTLQGFGSRANYSAVTDATGHFHFESVSPGQYQAMAYRDGFMPLQGNRFNPMSKPIAVAEEQQVKDLVMKLLPLAVVNGHVVDEDGDPLVRTQVQAMRYVYRQGGVRQLQPAGFGSTNDLGEFQLLDLEPGRYYFLAAAQPQMARLPANTKSAEPEQTYPDTFYPSASDAEQSTSTVVAAGAQVNGIDFRLHKAQAFHIRGKAVDGRTGEPIRNARIHVQTRGSVFFENASVRQNGSFDVPGAVSGSYMLILQTSEQLAVHQIVDVGDHDVNDVALVLRPPLEISGTIRLEGNPPAGEHRGQMQIGLNSLEMGSSAFTAVNADGSFALKAAPAVYQIFASCEASAYLKSIHFGDQDVSNGKLDLTQSATGALAIVCGTDVGQIQGSVQTEGGEPAAQALITIVPDEERQYRMDLHYQLISDQNGSFDYRDFAPGEYKVFAWESADADPQMLQSTEFRKAFESRAASVSVPAGGKASVQVKVISAADIEAEKNKLP
jgi:hypothetical protein